MKKGIKTKASICNLTKSRSLKYKYITKKPMQDKINEPIDPDIVLFGLIFVNFFPPKVFPNTYPPTSEKTQIISIAKKKYLCKYLQIFANICVFIVVELNWKRF